MTEPSGDCRWMRQIIIIKFPTYERVLRMKKILLSMTRQGFVRGRMINFNWFLLCAILINRGKRLMRKKLLEESSNFYDLTVKHYQMLLTVINRYFMSHLTQSRLCTCAFFHAGVTEAPTNPHRARKVSMKQFSAILPSRRKCASINGSSSKCRKSRK